MRRIVYTMSVSLDGFIEGPGGDAEWAVPDQALHEYFNEMELAFDTHIYGRGMWQGMVDFWPTADATPGIPPWVAAYAPLWRARRKFVFSKTLEDVPEGV